jgi:hypothetical protein
MATEWVRVLRRQSSGFEPDIIPGAMLAHRIMGIMAHWREYMGKVNICWGLVGFTDGSS